MKRVLVFGVFDNLHPGHIAFLKQAAAFGDELIVVVALDSVVKELKGKLPEQKLSERIKAIHRMQLADWVFAGDKKGGSYTIIKKMQPDLIALGYDQETLAQNLEAWKKKTEQRFEMVTLEPFEPEQFKSSLRRKHV